MSNRADELAEIRAAYDEWRGEARFSMAEHNTFGAGYLAGKRAIQPATEWVPVGELRRIHQTTFGRYGDCFACCVATLMGVDLSEIPPEVSSPAQFKAVREWALKRGWRVVTLSITEEVVKDQLAQGFVIVSGKSSRGLPHAVIFKDGKLWHDPHPSLDGVEVIDEVDLFMPLVPSEWSRLPPPPAADK